MFKSSLSKRLLSLFLSVMLAAEPGFSTGVGVLAAESSTENYNSVYAVKAIASLPKNIENQTVPLGTKETDLNLPKSIYALTIKEAIDSSDESNDTDLGTDTADTASKSSIDETVSTDIVLSDISTKSALDDSYISEDSSISSLDVSETATDSKKNLNIASDSETDIASSINTATSSTVRKSVDWMSDAQKEKIQKLLYSKTKPKISDLEKATGLDLSGYEIKELKLTWESDPAFGGIYDPEVPDVYGFSSSLKDESKYELYSVELPTINIEVTDDLTATDSVIYPVYVKTKNISTDKTLDFELTAEDDKDVEVYKYNFSSGTPEREEIAVEDGKFSLQAEDSDSDYYFTVLAPKQKIQLQILTDRTGFQNSAGTEALTLTAEADENFDLDKNSFMVVEKNPEITLEVKWEDGGRKEASKNILLGQDIDKLLYLEYSLDDDPTNWNFLDSEAMKKLGYTEEDCSIDSSLSLAEKTAVPTSYSYSFKNKLYDTYIERDADTGKLSIHSVKYRVAPKEDLKKHYFCSFEDISGNENENGDVLRNYEKKTFTATVKWNDIGSKDANGNITDRPSKDEWINKLSLSKVLKGDTENPETVELLQSSESEEGAITVSDAGNNSWTISVLGYGYDKDNYDIHYYLTEDSINLNDCYGSEGNPITNRHYETNYKNVNNAANITNALHDGGTLVNVLTGQTSYEIYSKWLDEADEKTINVRPKTSIILYRYANDGTVTDKSRWSNLSPIQDSDYVEIKDNIGTEKDGNINKLYKLIIPAADSLDAYNQDGAELIYVGKLKKTGGTSAYETTLYTKSGKNRELYNSHFILNGETLKHLIKGSISVTATKTWKASARQDVSSEVTLALYRTTKDPAKYPDTYDDKQYATKLSDTLTLSGFTSETQSKSTESVLEKYDEEGNRLYYFPREESVITKNRETGNMENAVSFEENGEKYFLTGDGYRYQQTYSYGDDGSAEASTSKTSDSSDAGTKVSHTNDSDDQSVTITNTLVGDAEILLKKTFSSGLSDHDKERGCAEVTFDIYRNSKKIGSVQRTYKAGEYLHSIDHDGKVTENKITDIEELYSSFTDEILIDDYSDMDSVSYTGISKGALPRYDENGAEYTYTAYEHGGIKNSGYYPTVHNSITEKERSFTLNNSDTEYTEKYLRVNVSIINSIGESRHISVYKDWSDGGDSEGREPVSFVLEHNVNGAWEQVGTEHTINPAEENYIYIEVPNELKSQYDAWRSGTAKNTFRIRETYVGTTKSSDHAVHYYDGSSNTIAQDYPDSDGQAVYLGHEWSKYEGGKKESFTNPKDKSDKYGFVRGSSYVYDVLINDNNSSADSQDSDSGEMDIISSYYDFTITNKRVGVVYLDVDAHEWIDGYLSSKARPDEIKLSVRMGSEICTFKLNESNGWKHRMGPFKKYNEDGSLIDYSPCLVSENGKVVNYIYNSRSDDEASFSGSYVLTTTENLTLGSFHTGDVYSFTLKHELKESIVPTVNKFWEDDAAGSLNRPDIVVNLYRTFTDKDNKYHLEQIDKDSYINFEWTTKNKNWWYVTYDPQPRFSPDDYYEYSYYIKEKIASEDTNDYVEIGAFPGSPTEVGNLAEFIYDAENPYLLLLENGKTTSAAKVTLNQDASYTIVNRKRNKRTVSGVKIYENLPKGFLTCNLPKIKLQLWRKTSAVDEAVHEYEKGTDLLGQETLNLIQNGAILTTILGKANESGETAFTFYNSNGKKAEVPKYDDKGRLYTYYIKEVGNTSTEEESEEDRILHHLFELTTSDTLTNGIKAINGYKTDTGYEVTFYKKWTVDDAVKKSSNETSFDLSSDKPSIKLRLYRYLQDESGIIEGSEELVSSSVSGTSEEDIVLYYDADHPEYSSYTWKKLAYYAPNLKPYVYVVSEYIGDDSGLYRKVYSAQVTESDGNISIIENDQNLYDLSADSYTKLLPSCMGKTVHDKYWTGFDTVVSGSYVIDTEKDYKGSGSGTAGLVNVYTGPQENTDAKKNNPVPSRGNKPNPSPDISDINTEKKEPGVTDKENIKPAEDEAKNEIEIPDDETIKQLTDEINKPEPGNDVKMPEKTETLGGSGNRSTSNSSSKGSGSPKPFNKYEVRADSDDTYDGSDSSLKDVLTAITGKEKPAETTFAEFLLTDKSSDSGSAEDLREILNGQRPFPNESESSSSGTGKRPSPQTGDESRMLLHGIGVLLSAIILGSWFAISKNKKS